MPKTRLNQDMRNALRRYAEQIVTPNAEHRSAEAAAYTTARDAVTAWITTHWPPADMQLLAKYDAARPDPCIYFRDSFGRVLPFHYTKEDEEAGKVPLLPRHLFTYYQYKHQLTEEATDTLGPLLQSFLAAKEQARKDYHERLQSYLVLITHARTAEDLIDVWPEAAEPLKAYMESAQLPMLSHTEAAKKVYLDMQRRKAEQQQD